MNEKLQATGEEDELVVYDFATSDKQEARAFLRERFLKVLSGIVGKQAKFYMQENTKVSAKVRGCDTEILEIFVQELKTPIGVIPEAILRSSDVIHFEIEESFDLKPL